MQKTVFLMQSKSKTADAVDMKRVEMLLLDWKTMMKTWKQITTELNEAKFKLKIKRSKRT